MIRGNTRPLLNKSTDSEIVLPMSIHNRFDIEVIDAKTGNIKQQAHAENIILDQLWAAMFSANAATRLWNKYIHYGSGVGTPTATRTSLFNFVGYGTPSTADDVDDFDSANGVRSIRRKITLSESMAVGVTLTEVGIGLNGSATGLVTHAMLKDMNGNTISILKTNTDIINIYATVFCHFDKPFRSFVSLYKNSKILKYALGMDSSQIGDFPCYAGCDGNNSSYISPTVVYSLATKTVTMTGTRVAAGSGNCGGLLSIIDNDGINHMYVDGWFSGSPITGEAIGTGDGSKKDFATLFGFVKTGAKIYVNGSEQVSGVSVDVGIPTVITNLILYFRQIDLCGNLSSESSIFSVKYQEPKIIYNPYYDKFGITQVKSNSSSVYKLETSNDLVNWTLINSSVGSSKVDVPSQHKNNKYWKLTYVSGSHGAYPTFLSTELTGYNIHFDTAPGSGAVITGDYTTALIAKDSNHVLDTTIVMSFGEKVI